MQFAAVWVRISNMIQVARKDNNESFENLLRRFNRKVQQSGNIAELKNRRFFEKPISKTERRKQSIISNRRNQQKLERMRFGSKLRGF